MWSLPLWYIRFLLHTEGHMYSAHETVGREYRHNSKESLPRLVNDTRVQEVKSNRVNAVIGKHNSLREAGSASRVGDRRRGVSYVFSLNRLCAFSTLDKGAPAHYSALSVRNSSSHRKMHGKLLEERKRGRRRLNDYMILIDLRNDRRWRVGLCFFAFLKNIIEITQLIY